MGGTARSADARGAASRPGSFGLTRDCRRSPGSGPRWRRLRRLRCRSRDPVDDLQARRVVGFVRDYRGHQGSGHERLAGGTIPELVASITFPSSSSQAPAGFPSSAATLVANVVSPSPFESAAPGPTPVASLLPLPNPGGTCSANQFLVGQSTSAYLPGTVSTFHVGVLQPVQNTGTDCLQVLPKVIGFADLSGPFHAVDVPIGNVEMCKKAPAGSGDHRVCNYVSTTSMQINSGQTVTIEFDAQWPIASSPTPPPCADSISDVTRAQFPLASGSLSIEWDIAFGEVCASPSRVSVTVTN